MWMDRRVFSKYKFEISSLKRKMLGKKKKKSLMAQDPYLRLLVLGMQSIKKGQISEKLDS